MNWINLKKNKCPQCDKDFTRNMTTYPIDGDIMLAHDCGFKISEQKYKEIVSGIVSEKIDQKIQRAEEVNEDEDLYSDCCGATISNGLCFRCKENC